jgi:Dyp-type peroxidase family
MPVDLNDTRIDVNAPQYQRLLTNLQGNILKGHGRDFTVHIFVRFTGDVQAVRTGLTNFAERSVTSQEKQLQEADQFQRFRIPGRLFGNVFLTAHGYEALGFTPDDVQANLREEKEEGQLEVLSSFYKGMHAHSDEFNDPAPAEWEPGYQEPHAIDAMFLIADDDPTFLKRQARTLIDDIGGYAEVLVVEHGVALRNEVDEGIEHFGYVDGRSQPLFLEQDAKTEGPTDVWDPFEPLKLVLVEDSFSGGAQQDCYGSFFVFRKLEQDVLRFKMNEQLLADRINQERQAKGLPPLTGEERERAGALVVGRFEDGTPVTLSPTDGFIPPKANNFIYADDDQGLKCPFQAHIRKANPRGDIEREFGLLQAEAERPRRIVRRGITFGERKRHPNTFQALEELPTRSVGGDTSRAVGLLFMCFQASIPKQFGFMQKRWCNAEGFLRESTGVDPVIGQKTPEVAAQNWPIEYDAPAGAQVQYDFGGFVTMKGGEFFFAPSIPFLRSFAAGASGGGGQGGA